MNKEYTSSLYKHCQLLCSYIYFKYDRRTGDSCLKEAAMAQYQHDQTNVDWGVKHYRRI